MCISNVSAYITRVGHSSHGFFIVPPLCAIMVTEVIALHKDAKFIGKNGSCGLINGKIYRIDISDNRTIFNPNPKHRYTVFPDGISFGIPYDTMNAIKKNWKFLYE